MKKLIGILLIFTIALAVPSTVGVAEDNNVEVAFTVVSNEDESDTGYLVTFPALSPFVLSGEVYKATSYINLIANHTQGGLTVTLDSSSSGGTGSADNPFCMKLGEDGFDIAYKISSNGENVTKDYEWTFQSNGVGVTSYTLEYTIISNVSYKPVGTYRDTLTFKVS